MHLPTCLLLTFQGETPSVKPEYRIKYGHGVIIPLLEGITHHFDSARFRQRAFHVLHELDRAHYLQPKVKEVMDSLRGIGIFTSTAWAAERAIEDLKFRNMS